MFLRLLAGRTAPALRTAAVRAPIAHDAGAAAARWRAFAGRLEAVAGARRWASGGQGDGTHFEAPGLSTDARRVLAQAEFDRRRLAEMAQLCGGGVGPDEAELGALLGERFACVEKMAADQVLFGRPVETTATDAERQERILGLADELVRQALGAATMVRLQRGGLVPEDVTLDTALPVRTQRQFAEPAPQSYRELFARVGDVDADGRPDLSWTTLSRAVPDASAADLIRATRRPIEPDILRSSMHRIGFDNDAALAELDVLTLRAGEGWGLAGATDFDQMRQQLLGHERGMVLEDSDEIPGLSAGDRVRYLDRSGQMRTTTFGALPQPMIETAQLHIAIVAVCKRVAALSYQQRMRFPKYDALTGASAPERVNESFWTVDRASRLGNQTSWKLKSGVRPCQAIQDVLENGGKYTTECAHGRTWIMTMGYLEYLTREFGEAAGRFRFDAHFTAGAERMAAERYFEGYQGYCAEHGGGDCWVAYQAIQAAPSGLVFGLELSRHQILDGQEHSAFPWATEPGSHVGGTQGYFSNWDVSPLGVRIGYVGENVVDCGYVEIDGEIYHMYWGHPGGMKTERAWVEELSSGRIPMRGIGDVFQYVDPDFKAKSFREISRSLTESTRSERESLIAEGGDEIKIAECEKLEAWYEALAEVRIALYGGVEGERADAARGFFTERTARSAPQSYAELVEVLTPEARGRLAGPAFEALHAEHQQSARTVFGTEALSEEQRAQAVLHEILTLRGQIHPHLQQEALQAVDDEAVRVAIRGPLASVAEFELFLDTEAFGTRYAAARGGARYEGPRTVEALTTAQLADLVRISVPELDGRRTIYAQVNRSQDQLVEQVARLMKGDPREASYRPGQATVPTVTV